MSDVEPVLNESRLSRNTTLAVAAALLLTLCLQAVFSMRQKSVTTDEIMYIAAGYYHLETGDFYLNETNPPLLKMLSALPLVSMGLELPEVEGDPGSWSLTEQWRYSRKFLFENTADADLILFWSRVPFVALAVLLGIYIFRWASQLYGRGAGLFALFLFAFSPNMLAHSRFATQDIGLTAFMFISCYYYWRFLRSPSLASMGLWGLFFGFALLSKITAHFLVPVFGLYGAVVVLRGQGEGIYGKLIGVSRIAERRVRVRQIVSIAQSYLIVGLIGLFVLNLGYLFQETFSRSLNEVPDSNVLFRLILMIPFELPIPVPGPYLKLLSFQFALKSSSGGVFFLGEIYRPGLWYLMGLGYLLKTPIASLALLGASLVWVVREFKKCSAEWLLLAFIGVIVLVFTYFSNVNAGTRYILPIYPFIFVLTSRLLTVSWRRTQPAVGAIVLLSLWYIFEAINCYPHYLSYFNQVAGGPSNGYRVLANSDVDWGQDLKLLKKYMDERDWKSIKLGFFGSADAKYYGIDYEYLPSVGLEPREEGELWWYDVDWKNPPRVEPQTGRFAVSANLLAHPQWLEQIFSSYDWFKDYEPVDQVGHSILIYEIDELKKP